MTTSSSPSSSSQATATRRPSDSTTIAGGLRGSGSRRRPDQPRQVGQRHHLALELQRGTVAERRRAGYRDDPSDARHRQPEGVPAALEEQDLHQRERERQQQGHLRSRAGLAAHLEAAAETLDVSLDRVEADSAPGDLGDPLGGREPGLGEDVDERALLLRSRQQLGRDAAAVVGHLDRDHAAALFGAQLDPAGRRLSGRLALARRCSIPCATALRRRWTMVSEIPSRITRSSCVSAPLDRQLHLLALLRRRGRGSRAGSEAVIVLSGRVRIWITESCSSSSSRSPMSSSSEACRPSRTVSPSACSRRRWCSTVSPTDVEHAVDLRGGNPDRRRARSAPGRRWRPARSLPAPARPSRRCRPKSPAPRRAAPTSSRRQRPAQRVDRAQQRIDELGGRRPARGPAPCGPRSRWPGSPPPASRSSPRCP